MKTSCVRAWRRLRRTGILSLLLLVLAVFSFRSAIADWNDVPTGSMKPTIMIGDRIVVNKLAYDLKIPFTRTRLATWGQPASGDIVVCWSPADGTRLVKRVIGVPGDVIALRDNRLLLNGRPVAYEPLRDDKLTAAMGEVGRDARFAQERLPGRTHLVATLPQGGVARDFGPVRVPDGGFFVMGDNRDQSADSRYFGFVARDAIVGRVPGLAFSLDYDDWYKPRWSRFFTRLI